MVEVKFFVKFLVLFLVLSKCERSLAENMLKYPGEDCYRDCQDSESKICYFHFNLEHYHAMGPICGTCGDEDGNPSDCYKEECVTGDGTIRGIMSINRQIPGPPIHVCHNDKIVVDVTNKMAGTAATIHWHGFHQRKTPFYDGVPFVTQCPISFANTFRYSFWASEPGTQFYHSHSGHHKTNGIYGGIAVRRALDQDPHGLLYNFDLKEHMIEVSDWMENYAEMFMPGLPKHKSGNEPTNILINGKAAKWDELTRKSKSATPLEVFHVEEGQRYRFRFVNSMATACPAELEIENHSMLVIASDSYDLQPVSVDQLVSTSGERYDFVLNANQSHHGDTFWIKIRALGPCAVTRQVQQFAVLTYQPKSMDEDHQLAFPTRPIPGYSQHFVSGDAQYNSLNHPNTTCGKVKSLQDLCICDVHSLSFRPEITHGEPDHRFVLGFKNWDQEPEDIFGGQRYEHFMFLSAYDRLLVSAVNNISLNFPPMSLLTQTDEYDDSLFCDQDNRPEHCTRQICHCVHRLKIPLNSVVELVVADVNEHINELNHPFHLHGTSMYVMEMGQKEDNTPITLVEVEDLVKVSKARRYEYAPNFLHPVKDTISIPSNGFTRFRFKADNPGFWLLHCHFEWHLAVGMGLVLQVGEVDEMAKPPHGFPKCNNFKPSVDEAFRRSSE